MLSFENILLEYSSCHLTCLICKKTKSKKFHQNCLLKQRQQDIVMLYISLVILSVTKNLTIHDF